MFENLKKSMDASKGRQCKENLNRSKDYTGNVRKNISNARSKMRSSIKARGIESAISSLNNINNQRDSRLQEMISIANSIIEDVQK
ncbi:MAG: hypothetical protein E7214_00405 [Clostridium sp.]|nr:hypothetical protein [Clostridium sp.]